MYTKKILYELRDELLANQNKIASLSKGSTALFICQEINLNSDPEKLERSLHASTVMLKGVPVVNDHEIDYELAYNILFGDLSDVLLHINDGLAIVAKWRLKKEEQITKYTRDDMMELRDILLKEMYSGKYEGDGDEKATARHIVNLIMFQTDPDLLREKMAAYAHLDKKIGQDPKVTHYKIAYDTLFGDISVPILHINNFLSTIATWRLKKASSK